MPLAFESLSHGTIAFGFFNIESDMLLLDHYFMFAADFCGYIKKLAGTGGGRTYRAEWPIWNIEAAEDIGDLMGAINGARFTGFIGALYRRFPFPRRREDFKQNPEGFRSRKPVSEMIAKFAAMHEISVVMPAGGHDIEIGIYRFRREQFQELILYVWRGGYPGWKDDIRPDCVTAMKNTVSRNRAGIFEGIVFDGSGTEPHRDG